MNRLRIILGVGLVFAAASATTIGVLSRNARQVPPVSETARARDGRGRLGRGGAAACAVTIQGGAFSSDWTELHAGTTAATLTFNTGTGPPGSCASANLRLRAPATTAASYAGIVIQTPPSGAGSQMCIGGTSNISWGFFAKATGTQTLDLCQNDNANNTQCFTCPLVANTWVFCAAQNKAWWIQSNAFYIGNLTNFIGSGTRPALDVQLYAPRCVVGATISS